MYEQEKDAEFMLIYVSKGESEYQSIRNKDIKSRDDRKQKLRQTITWCRRIRNKRKENHLLDK